MANEIISYLEMCRREGVSLQRGMNFGIGATHSVILMSLRPNAPYEDRIDGDGTILIYEGHDEPRTAGIKEPKAVDQPRLTTHGRLTQNGQFEVAAAEYKAGKRQPERVRVYRRFIPAYGPTTGCSTFLMHGPNGPEADQYSSFDSKPSKAKEDFGCPVPLRPERRRIIPAAVKLEVWKRDNGKCVICGASDELHFDHDLPFSLGGTSITAANVQLLCARHNLSKGARIR